MDVISNRSTWNFILYSHCIILYFLFPSIVFAKVKSNTECFIHGHIKKAPVNIRIGPGEEYKILFQAISKSIPVNIRYQNQDNWCFIQIKSVQDKKGWINCNALVRKSKLSFLIKDTQLYRRPSSSNQIITILRANSRIIVNECRTRICRVSLFLNRNITGFIDRNAIWNTNCIDA